MMSIVGIWHEHYQAFLWVLILFTSLAFALPIFLMPITWARWLQWRLPKEDDGRDLAVYFGRCLGAFVLILEWLMIRAALNGDGAVYTFQVLLMTAVFMVIVHTMGAIQRIQPKTETLEIFMYGGLGLLALLFYPG